MPSYSDFVRDDYQRPIPGALAQLFAIDGTTLIDTAITGADGQFTVTGPDAKCFLQVSFGGASERSTVIVGNPPEYTGPPGGSDSAFDTLAALKASDPLAHPLPRLNTAAGVVNYAYLTGDFTGKADDLNVVALDGTPVTEGALVRQASDLTQASAVALTTAIDAATVAGGNIVRLGKGVFLGGITLTNRAVGLEGRGISTVINPTTADGVGGRTTANVPSWDTPQISGLNYVGTGARQGVGFRFGDDTYTAGVEYTGRLSRVDCRYSNWDVCADRPYGSIGDYATGTRYETANIHTKAIANPGSAAGGVGDPMHAGCSFFENEHRQGAMVVSDYVDGRNVIGTCQIIRRSNIIESNPGHVHYFTNVRHMGGFPAIKIADEYNEANSTATSVTTPDGVTTTPAWLYANASNLTILDNAAPARVTLIGSALLTYGSDLTSAAGISSADTGSTWVNRDVRCFTGKAPGLTMSIVEVQNPVALNAPTYEMPVLTSIGVSSGDVLFTSSAQVSETWVGTVTRVSESNPSALGLPFMQRVQRITIGAGQTLFPAPTFSIAANKYIVIKYVCRLISGPGVVASINGASGVGGSITINNVEMRTHVGIFRNGGTGTGAEQLYHLGGVADSVIEFAGYCVKQFDTAQEALAFANDSVFPVEARPAWALTVPTQSRTIDASVGVPAADATYSQANTQTIVDIVNGTRAALATLVLDLSMGRYPQ